MATALRKTPSVKNVQALLLRGESLAKKKAVAEVRSAKESSRDGGRKHSSESKTTLKSLDRNGKR